MDLGDSSTKKRKKKDTRKWGEWKERRTLCEKHRGLPQSQSWSSSPARQVMKAKVDPRKTGLEVLYIWRTRKEEALLVLKKGGNVSAFRKELDQAVVERAEISALVSTRSLEIRNLDETVEKEEVVSTLCFGGMKTAVIRLAEADVARLL